MLMERMIHFLFRKRTWQAQFEWLHEGHMHGVILASWARRLSKEQWKPPMSKLVSCPLWFFTQMLIRPTGKVDTGRVCPLPVDLGIICGVWLKAAHHLKSDTPPDPGRVVPSNTSILSVFSTLCMKDEISLNHSISLAETLLWSVSPLEKSNLWLGVEWLYVFHVLDGSKTSYPIHLGWAMTEADGAVGIWSQHHLPETAKPKGHMRTFSVVWGRANSAFQRWEG